MKVSFSPILLALVAAGVAGACVHTPPGTSVEIALAKRAELIRLPSTPKPTSLAHAKVPSVEPALPDLNDRVEAVADAYTRGKFAMEERRDLEAIKAFEETVKIDPTHVEAWQNLALLYERKGEEKKAMTAFRNAKKIAAQ